MPDANVHFSAVFTKTSDLVNAESEKVKSGSIKLGNNLDGGSAVLTVNDVELDSSKIKEILLSEAENNKISKEVVDCLFKNYNHIINQFEKEKKNTLGLYLKIKDQFGIIMKEFEKLE